MCLIKYFVRMFIAFITVTSVESGSKSPVEGRSEEYCNTETFKPGCASGEVIVIEDAIYGRHHIGKCIDADEANTFKDPRYFGCSINVRQFINTKCAARKTCEVRIADAELEKNSPCLKGLKMFLEASFSCVAVVEEDRSCIVSVTSSPLHIARPSTNISSTTQHKYVGLHCGTKRNPWLLEAPSGKRLKISLLDFTQNDAIVSEGFSPDTISRSHEPHSASLTGRTGSRGRGGCTTKHQYGYIIDKSSTSVDKKNVSICPASDSERLTFVYMSTSNTVELTLTEYAEYDVSIREHVVFLVRVEAVGCTDLNPPEDAWMKREDDKLIIGCYLSRQSWQLRCEDGRWIGVVSNCTKSVAAGHEVDQTIEASNTAEIGDSYQVVVTIAIGFAGLAICLTIICCGVVCLQRYRVQTAAKLKFTCPSKYGFASLHSASGNTDVVSAGSNGPLRIA